MTTTEITRRLNRDASMISRLCASYDQIETPRRKWKLPRWLEKKSRLRP